LRRRERLGPEPRQGLRLAVEPALQDRREARPGGLTRRARPRSAVPWGTPCHRVGTPWAASPRGACALRRGEMETESGGGTRRWEDEDSRDEGTDAAVGRPV